MLSRLLSQSYISFKVSQPLYPFSTVKVDFDQDISLKKVALFLDKKPGDFKPARSFQKEDVHPIGVLYNIHDSQTLNRVQMKDCWSKTSRSDKSLRKGSTTNPFDFYKLHQGTLSLCDHISPTANDPRSYIHILNNLFHTHYRHLIGTYYHTKSLTNYEDFLHFIGNLLINDQSTWPLMYLKEKEGLELVINHLSKSASFSQLKQQPIAPKVINEKKTYPDYIEAIIAKETAKMSQLEPHHSEYHLTKQYINVLQSIPFTTFKQSPIALDKLKLSLESHYGLDKVKDQILNYMSLLRYTNQSSNVLLLVGPPGTGKTSIVNSIAKALNRQLFRIPLGGLNDPSELKGHRRTYIGSMPGKLINALVRTKSMDPVVLLDEIDKLSRHHTGDPSSVLLEVLDPEQHHEFMDHYVDAPISLSHCMFIATANTTDTIPAPLLDRCTVVEIDGYTIEDKIEMTTSHLLPKLKEKYRVELAFSPSVLNTLVECYCREAGVRQLNKSLERIGQEYIREQLSQTDLSVVQKEQKNPFSPPELELPKVLEQKQVTMELLQKYLGAPKYTDQRYSNAVPGVVMGLAWTSMGGSTLYIESIVDYLNEKKANFQITGHLKQVMKESASIAYTYAKQVLYQMDKTNKLFTSSIHIHIPSGGTPKDGPSAGITMCTSLLSLALNRPVPIEYAMTGELTLTGKVLRIGGLREKVIAAKRQKVTKIIFPRDNMADWLELPEKIRENVTPIPVDWYSEILLELFPSLYVPSSGSLIRHE